MVEPAHEYTPEVDTMPRAAKRGRELDVCAEASSREADGTDIAITEPNNVALPSYDLGAGVNRADTGKDPSGIVGKMVTVPNRLWDSRLKGATQCNVSGFIGPYKFGRFWKATYVIKAMDDGLFYPVAAEYLTKIMPIEAVELTFVEKVECIRHTHALPVPTQNHPTTITAVPPQDHTTSTPPLHP